MEQLPLPELCLPAAPLAVLCLDPAHLSILPSHAVGGGGGLVVGHAGAPHDDVEPIRGGLGCVSVAGPLHHLLPPLCAGLELLNCCLPAQLGTAFSFCLDFRKYPDFYLQICILFLILGDVQAQTPQSLILLDQIFNLARNRLIRLIFVNMHVFK